MLLDLRSRRQEKDDPSLITGDRGHEGNITSVSKDASMLGRRVAQFGVAPERTDVPNS